MLQLIIRIIFDYTYIYIKNMNNCKNKIFNICGYTKY